MRLYSLTFFVFSFFYIVFWSFLFDILFLFFSPFYLFSFISSYPSLLISSYSSYSSRTILRLLFLLFSYLNLFVVLQTCILFIKMYFNSWKIAVCGKRFLFYKLAKHISVILRVFLRGPCLFWSSWGQSLYWCDHLILQFISLLILLFLSLLILLVLYSASSYSYLLIFKLIVVLQTCVLNTHLQRYIHKRKNYWITEKTTRKFQFGKKSAKDTTVSIVL